MRISRLMTGKWRWYPPNNMEQMVFSGTPHSLTVQTRRAPISSAQKCLGVTETTSPPLAGQSLSQIRLGGLSSALCSEWQEGSRTLTFCRHWLSTSTADNGVHGEKRSTERPHTLAPNIRGSLTNSALQENTSFISTYCWQNSIPDKDWKF